MGIHLGTEHIHIHSPRKKKKKNAKPRVLVFLFAEFLSLYSRKGSHNLMAWTRLGDDGPLLKNKKTERGFQVTNVGLGTSAFEE